MSRRVVWGLEGIGGVINRTEEEVRWLIRQRRIRVRRHGPRTLSAIEDELIEDCGGEILEAEKAAS
jgi:hypothetical protein